MKDKKDSNRTPGNGKDNMWIKNTLSRINTKLDALGEKNSELKIWKQKVLKMKQHKQTENPEKQWRHYQGPSENIKEV